MKIIMNEYIHVTSKITLCGTKVTTSISSFISSKVEQEKVVLFYLRVGKEGVSRCAYPHRQAYLYAHRYH